MEISLMSQRNIGSNGNKKEKVRGATLRGAFSTSPTQIWRSRISWRIASAAFMTILLVQTLVLNLGGAEEYRKQKLHSLSEAARVALAATVNPLAKSTTKPPFSSNQIDRLIQGRVIMGMSLYSYRYDFIAAYGNSTHIEPKIGRLNETYYAQDAGVYEVIFSTADLQNNKFMIVAQIDAHSVEAAVYDYVMRSIVIMVILSLLVTTVLMIALGKWLLEPILFMRANLLTAFRSPEAPEIQPSPYGTSDEMGAVIDFTQKLIEQNAENLRNIKSTAEDKIHQLAYYDGLTGLPNRSLFLQTLDQQARLQKDGGADRFAVISVDLDHFKDINDSMGHNVGDAILRSVGKKLRASLPDAATVSRTGEDEFAIMMPLSGQNLEARSIADRVMGVIRAEPFKVFNEEFQVRASIGVSTFPDDGKEPDVVLKNADVALNRAKEEGRDNIKAYSEDFDRAVQQRFQMLRDLRGALEEDQLELYFQPQLCLKTGKIIGAEALLRWWKPDNSKDGGAFISPAQFIPVAEQSGLIVPIGQWVLKQAFQTAKMFKDEKGIDDIRFAINVSGSQFVHSDICKDVSDGLAESGLDPKMIELEVTESVFMDDIGHTVSVLNDLNALGVELAIDDFGTGYSSLSYLSQFPIDRLKIDQSFVRNALNDKHNESIARTIINLGHSLNLKVIAEGVETKDHETFLIKEGCDEVQGFRYSRPVPIADFAAFVDSYNGKLSSFDL